MPVALRSIAPLGSQDAPADSAASAIYPVSLGWLAFLLGRVAESNAVTSVYVSGSLRPFMSCGLQAVLLVRFTLAPPLICALHAPGVG
jgi:hypothetical protein